MDHGPPGLQPRPQHIQRPDDRSTKRAAEFANYCDGHGSRFGILPMQAIPLIPMDDPLLDILKRGEIDCRVGELTEKAPEQATVEWAQSPRCPHFPRGLRNEPIALDAAFHKFALHAESESIDRIGSEPNHISSVATAVKGRLDIQESHTAQLHHPDH